jgi:hypothetical protein
MVQLLYFCNKFKSAQLFSRVDLQEADTRRGYSSVTVAFQTGTETIMARFLSLHFMTLPTELWSNIEQLTIGYSKTLYFRLDMLCRPPPRYNSLSSKLKMSVSKTD